MKGVKNQNVCVIVFNKKLRVNIPSAFSAIYGHTTKLNTVIGIRIIKYNFSVDARVLNET